VSRGARLLRHPVTGAVCRLVLGGIFIYTAVPKLLHPDEFARLINGYRVLHPDLVNLAGITMPWVELIAGALLVLGIVPQSAALVLGVLLVGFMGAGFAALARGLEISCGCFFPFMGGDRLGWDLFPRDLALLLLAVQVMLWPSSFIPIRSAGEETRREEGGPPVIPRGEA
jgi:putative oxidoreductase